ncbi:hypothetical protein ACF0H5_015232 [Mactra antiquata]
MIRLDKGNPLLTYISMYLIVMIVLTELYQISATSQIDQSDTNSHQREKRHFADIDYWDRFRGHEFEKATLDLQKLLKENGKKRSGFYREFY